MRSPTRRQPKPGENGIYIAFWAPTEVVSEIDTLADHYQLNRSAAIKQAVHERLVTIARKAKRQEG